MTSDRIELASRCVELDIPSQIFVAMPVPFALANRIADQDYSISAAVQ